MIALCIVAAGVLAAGLGIGGLVGFTLGWERGWEDSEATERTEAKQWRSLYEACVDDRVRASGVKRKGEQ
jgi:hypothetical protein